MEQYHQLNDRIRGVLVGTAVGDSLGLPAEGLTPDVINKLGWNNWRHRLFLGKGMISDDTEHTIFVAQSLLANDMDSTIFQKRLAWQLKLWLLSAPAGIGFGTLRAILKLWVGFSPEKSGVYSAGNGPAMRCAIIGARFMNDEDKLISFTEKSTLLTHRDPKALIGALAVSYATEFAIKTDRKQMDKMGFLEKLKSLGKNENEWVSILEQIENALSVEKSVKEFANELGLSKGITGYIYHTVPMAIYSWLLNYGDFKKTITDLLDCGGDTDTVGAIAGALAGASVGESNIPTEWIDNIIEYPRNCNLLHRIADRVTEQVSGNKQKEVHYFWVALLPRNIFFTIIVLLHGISRVIPAPLRKFIIKVVSKMT